MTAGTESHNNSAPSCSLIKFWHKQAENVFAYHGLTLPEAITVFLNHACHAGGFPFELRKRDWNDPVSLAALEEAEVLVKNPNAKRYRNVADLISDCLDGAEDDD